MIFVSIIHLILPPKNPIENFKPPSFFQFCFKQPTISSKQALRCHKHTKEVGILRDLNVHPPSHFPSLFSSLPIQFTVFFRSNYINLLLYVIVSHQNRPAIAPINPDQSRKPQSFNFYLRQMMSDLQASNVIEKHS